MKDIESMTLAEIKDHQKTSEAINKVMGCNKEKALTNDNPENFGVFTNYQGRYVIIRTYSAGVFAGILKARIGQEVELTEARRIWYWDGANSLSQMASDGVANPQNCKFAAPIEIQLTQVIEIIPVSALAEKIIRAVAIWKK